MRRKSRQNGMSTMASSISGANVRLVCAASGSEFGLSILVGPAKFSKPIDSRGELDGN